MARVQMLQHISGGRGDGTEWPHRGGILDCGEDEARDLVSGQLARWAVESGAEERAVMPADGPELAAAVPADDSAGDEPPDAENGSQPLVRDPKQAWVDHAVENGATPEEAAAMTKADLIEKYGNPA
jgi:hypothetical protein